MPAHRFAKHTPVLEVDHDLDIGPVLVRQTDDLLTVARRAFRHPSTRLLAVVDEADRLVGVIPVLRVVEEVVAHAAPEQLMADVTNIESAVRFGREVGAHTCGDLMSPPVALHRTSTVADAFRAMREHHYSGLPVVDDDGQVIAYIDLLELALRYLEERGSAAGIAHPEQPTGDAPEPAPEPPSEPPSEPAP